MIELKGLSKHYQLSGDTLVKAVDNVNLTIKPGEFMMIAGRSGSGKTTLLSLIGGLTKPTSGTVNIDGVNIWTLNDATQSRFRAEMIGFVFQIPSLLPTLSVLDNVKLPTMFSKEHDNVGEKALSLLDMVGLSEKAHAYPSQLSVGQQKRVALARSLINEPEVVLADEPTSDLDKATEQEIMTLIKKVHDDGPRTMVMVTHNLDLIGYATEVRTMANGSLDEGTRK
jgi:putative ABC transport system ATP-binding protein/lipoprotein-releasing system ATP-binding protein